MARWFEFDCEHGVGHPKPTIVAKNSPFSVHSRCDGCCQAVYTLRDALHSALDAFLDALDAEEDRSPFNFLKVLEEQRSGIMLNLQSWWRKEGDGKRKD